MTNQKYPEKIISETIFFCHFQEEKNKNYKEVKESGEIFALYEKDCKIRGKENFILFINITQHIFLLKEHEEKYNVIIIDLNLTKIQKK